MKTSSKTERVQLATRAKDFRGDLASLLAKYTYQPDLTGRLDKLGNAEVTQELINEIVLWKVNRYVSLPLSLLRDIGGLRRLEPNQHREAASVLTALLTHHGVDLAMASTILRFRNPAVFQIIDRHAYRAVYGQKYPLSPKCTTERKLALYFDYIDALVDLCTAKGLAFVTIDRVLYKYDQAENGKL